MEKIFVDFTEESKVSATKEKARQTVVEDLIAYLSERYDVVRQIASNELGIVIGSAKDENGFASDVVITLKATCRPWYDKTDCKRPVERFDLEYEAETYEAEKAAKSVPKK
jgi:acyl-CoA reductase-like NAD-dependent aldehyde dehydrogenase